MALAHPTLNTLGIDDSPFLLQTRMNGPILFSRSVSFLIRQVAQKCMPYNPNAIPSTLFLCWTNCLRFTAETHLLDHRLVRFNNHKMTCRYLLVPLRIPIRSFPTFKSPLHLWPRPLENIWFNVFSLPNNTILNFQWVPGYAGVPGNTHADSLPKAGASLPCQLQWSFVPLPAIAKTRYTRITNGYVTFPHSPSHFNCPVILFLRRNWSFHVLHLCFKLSNFASMVKASYYCHEKTLPAPPVNIFFRILILSFLPVLPLSLNANLFLALQFSPWRVA